MDGLKENYDKLIVFVKDHKPLVLLVSIFIIIIIIILLVVAANSGSQAPGNNGQIVDPTDQGNNDDIPDLGNDDEPDDNNDDDEPDQDNDGSVELNVWGGFISESIFDSINSDFESDNSGVTINYTQEITRNSEIPAYINNLADELDSDLSSAPDIFMVKNTWADQFHNEAVASSSDQISSADFTNNYPEFLQVGFTNNDNVLGVPMWVETNAVIYNEAIWTEAGEAEPAANWADFITQLESIPDEYDGNTIAKLNISDTSINNTEFWFEFYNGLLAQNEVLNNSSGIDFASETEIGEVDQLIDDLTTASAWESSYNVGIASFLEGKLATYIAPSWRLNELLVLNKAAGLDLDIEVAQLPTISGESETAYASSWGFMVNTESDNAEAAWEYLNYLSSESTLQDLNDKLEADANYEIGLVFPHSDLLNSQSQEPYLGAYANSLQDGTGWKMYSELEIEPIFQQYLEEDLTLSELRDQVDAITEN